MTHSALGSTKAAELRSTRDLRSSGSVLVLVAAAGLVPLLTQNPFYLHLGVLIYLNAIFVIGLGIIARVGQLSFAHGAFAAIGAYSSVHAVMGLGMPYLAGVALGAAVAGMLAAAIGWIILRLRGVYFVLVTFSIGELTRLLLLDFPAISGGANGLTGVPPASFLGFELASKTSAYYYALIAAALVFVFAYALVRSPVGRAFAAIEENAALAEGSGIDTRSFQVLAFVIGSAVAGGGGAMLAHYIGFISPETFNLHFSIAIIIMLVVGGRKSLAGPIVGALFLTPLPELLRATVALQHILFGFILILALRFLPEGLAGIRVYRRKSTGVENK